MACITSFNDQEWLDVQRKGLEMVNWYKSFSQTLSPSSAELYCSSYGVSSVNVSLAFYKPITGTGTRGDFVNNGLSIAAEDIVWVEAQKPCSAPIFQNSYKLLMNTSHKYKYNYYYKWSGVRVSAAYLSRQSHLRCTL